MMKLDSHVSVSSLEFVSLRLPQWFKVEGGLHKPFCGFKKTRTFLVFDSLSFTCIKARTKDLGISYENLIVELRCFLHSKEALESWGLHDSLDRVDLYAWDIGKLLHRLGRSSVLNWAYAVMIISLLKRLRRIWQGLYLPILAVRLSLRTAWF